MRRIIMHVRLLRPPKIQAKANRYSYKIQIQLQTESYSSSWRNDFWFGRSLSQLFFS